MAHLGPQKHKHDLEGYHKCPGLEEPVSFDTESVCEFCGAVLVFTEPEHPYSLWEEATEAKYKRMLAAVKAGKNPGNVK